MMSKIGGAIGKATGSGSDAKVLPEPGGDEKPAEANPSGKSGMASAVMSKAAGGVEMVTGAAGTAASAASGAAHVAAPIAADAAKKAASGAATAAVAGAGAAKHAAEYAYDKAEDIALHGKEKLQEMVKKLREYLEAWVKQKIQKTIEKAVDRLPGLAKTGLEDPEMPRCVSRGKDRLIDSMWPDLREEIMWEVAVLIDGVKMDEDDPDWKGVDCFRAFWRYHLMPYNKTIWGKLRDPVWVGFTLFSLVPVYGVSQLVFTFIFLVMDRSDEFQLINFILSFKGMQFITMGILRAVTGYGYFMMCVTARAKKDHSCEEDGPGNRGDMLIISAGLFLQVILVWVAFTLLRCSVEKGRSRLKGVIGHEVQGSAKTSGGYISYFLWWDLACFLLCCTIPAYTVSTRPSAKLDDWVIAQTVFAAQILYGLLSCPFFLFTLPGLQRVLTHAMPTAYDKKGRCRKLEKPKKPKEQPKRPAQGELVSEEEADQVFFKIRSMFPFGAKQPAV